MEYVYAAMLLHSAGKKIDENSVTSILKAPGIEVDDARVKALVSALDGVNIEDAIKQAAVAQVAQAPAAAAEVKEEANAEDEEEEKKKEEETEEEAMAGLGALFG
jgi:large subunit ribosomal protein L12